MRSDLGLFGVFLLIFSALALGLACGDQIGQARRHTRENMLSSRSYDRGFLEGYREALYASFKIRKGK